MGQMRVGELHQSGAADGDVATYDSGTDLWVPQSPTTGGFAQSYAGTSTIGGTWETVTTRRVYLKKVTLAADGMLASVEAYIRQSGAAGSSISAGVYSDVSGSPTLQIATGAGGSIYPALGSTPGSGRWMSVPLGKWATAGDYWIAVFFFANNQDIAVDTASGTDRIYTSNADTQADANGGVFTVTNTSKTYSLRANFLS